MNSNRKLYLILMILTISAGMIDITVKCHGVNSHNKKSWIKYLLKGKKTMFTPYIQMCKDKLTELLSGYDKYQQTYIAAFLVSSPSFPIMFLLLIFKIKNLRVLNILTAFASGSLIGDVFIHNIPEIMTNNQPINLDYIENEYLKSIVKFLLEKEILLCLGIMIFFFIEKLILLISHEENKVSTVNHEHNHHHSEKQRNLNIMICIIGDTLHNVTDGLALGAAFSKS